MDPRGRDPQRSPGNARFRHCCWHLYDYWTDYPRSLVMALLATVAILMATFAGAAMLTQSGEE